MEKTYMLNYIDSQMNALESIKKSVKDENLLSLIDTKLETLSDIRKVVEKAPVPYDLI